MADLDALGQWGQFEVLSKFEGGLVSDVFLVRLGEHRAVARFGSRPDDYLAWEIELLEYLSSVNIRVPRFISALDGRKYVDGLSVMEFIDGDEATDKSKVCEYLKSVHQATLNYKQRPQCITTTSFGSRMTGENLDLSLLPSEMFQLCRDAWVGLENTPRSVIHGDPSPGNTRATSEGVVLLDWDEARVDSSIIDYGFSEQNASGLPDSVYLRARKAYLAWDAAVCWSLERGHKWGQQEFEQLVQLMAPSSEIDR